MPDGGRQTAGGLDRFKFGDQRKPIPLHSSNFNMPVKFRDCSVVSLRFFVKSYSKVKTFFRKMISFSIQF